MKIYIDNLEGDNVEATNYMSKFNYETSLEDIFETITFQLPYYFFDESKIKIFSRVTAYSKFNGEKVLDFQGIVINTEIDDLLTATLTVVSNSYYLSAYEEIIKVKNFGAKKTIEKVIQNYDNGFKVDSIVLNNKISKIYKGETIIGIIDDVISQSEGFIAKKIYRTFEKDTLRIFTEATAYKLDLTYSISNLKLSYNGEDIKTRVKVFTEDSDVVAVEVIKENSELIQKAGVIQKVHEIKVINKAEAELVAKNLLEVYSMIKRTGSFTIFGDYKARVGMSVTVESKDYLIASLNHTLEDKIHLMNVGVIAYEK